MLIMLICLTKGKLRNLNSGVDMFFLRTGKDTKQISASESITLSFTEALKISDDKKKRHQLQNNFKPICFVVFWNVLEV